MKDVINFLLANGFELSEKNSYGNGICNVVIEEDHYAVANNDGDAMYSKDLNIYWLIGVLTYYGYMSKNYKQFSVINSKFL